MQIEIDYEGLPKWVIREIENYFDDGGMGGSKDYTKWQGNLISFIKTIPKQYWVIFLQKGIEFAQKSLAYHKEFECNAPNNCSENESWERRIALAQALLEPVHENTSTSNIKFAGSKIDLIRVLNALYELKKIEDLKGQIPTKESFMITTGQFFNVDLTNYETDLSQAYNSGKTETNLKIFNDLLKITQDKCFEKEK